LELAVWFSVFPPLPDHKNADLNSPKVT
jgi:hypothetical protein